MPMPVCDDASVVSSDGRMRFYVAEAIGETRMRTPEGFLLCLNVPICRTGTQLYHVTELHGRVEGDSNGVVRIHRDEADVFTDEHIASYNGKPVVNDHPAGDVTPENYRDLVVGVNLNPRRGTGMQSDCILADQMIYCPLAIADVDSGKRQVSCGYDADFEKMGPGEGRQKNLVGNHVALVDAGRCGPRCSIGDHTNPVHPSGDYDMRFQDQRPAWLDRLLSRLPAAERDTPETRAMIADAEAAVGSGDVHLHMGDAAHRVPAADADLNTRVASLETGMRDILGTLRTMDAKLTARDADEDEDEEEKKKKEAEKKEVEDSLEEEAPMGVGDRARKARDSMYLGDSFQQTVAMAEILTPGIRVPVYDQAMAPAKTLDAICALRRSSLDLFNNTPEGRGVVDSINGGRAVNLQGLSCAETRRLFLAAAAIKKQANNGGNRGAAHDGLPTSGSGGGLGVRSKLKSPAEINEANRKRYGVGASA